MTDNLTNKIDALTTRLFQEILPMYTGMSSCVTPDQEELSFLRTIVAVHLDGLTAAYLEHEEERALRSYK